MLDDFLEKFRLDDLPDFRQIIYLSDDMINIEFEYIKECFILDKILKYLKDNNLMYDLNLNTPSEPDYINKQLIIYFF